MDRKFLEEMGLEKESIDKILDNHHKSLEDYKEKAKTSEETIKTLQEDIKTKDESIKKLSESGQTAEELKKALEEITIQSEQQKKDYESKLDERDFMALVKDKIQAKNPKNIEMAMKMLDLETLKKSNNRDTDLEEALKNLVEGETTSFLFGEAESKPIDNINTVGRIDNGKPATIGGIEAAFLARNPDLKV